MLKKAASSFLFLVGFDNSVILERPAGYLRSHKPFYKQLVYYIINRGVFPIWLGPLLATATVLQPKAIFDW